MLRLLNLELSLDLFKNSMPIDSYLEDIENITFLSIIFTRNELALLAHYFYTCLKHQLMLPSIIVLLSSTLDYVAYMM